MAYICCTFLDWTHVHYLRFLRLLQFHYLRFLRLLQFRYLRFLRLLQLGEKEPDGISEQTHASVISGEPNGKYADDYKRQVTWRDLP